MSEQTAGFLTAPAAGTPYDDGSEMGNGSQPYPGIQRRTSRDGGPGNTKLAS